MGLLDIDICGPSVPKMLGLEGEEIHQSGAGWSPVYVQVRAGRGAGGGAGGCSWVAGACGLGWVWAGAAMTSTSTSCSPHPPPKKQTTKPQAKQPMNPPRPGSTRPPAPLTCCRPQENLGVMSIGFMLPNPDDAVIWRGPRKNGLIKQFLKDVHWGECDYLIIDSPPGTSDEHISIAQVGVLLVGRVGC